MLGQGKEVRVQSGKRIERGEVVQSGSEVSNSPGNEVGKIHPQLMSLTFHLGPIYQVQSGNK